MLLPQMTIIGPGRVGVTLTRLLFSTGCIRVGQLIASHRKTAENAVAFIGAGEAAEFETLQASDIILIATPDDTLGEIAARLVTSAAIREGTIVFHASGSIASSILAPLQSRGASIASIHPLMSFSTPATAIDQFAGCYCGIEGDAAALVVLLPMFAAIGAHCFPVDGSKKLIYHAAAVLACNDFTALLHAAFLMLDAAGVPAGIRWPALKSLIDTTLVNIDLTQSEGKSIANALTGPIARGDAALVARQYAAVCHQDRFVGAAYKALGQIANQLSQAETTARQSIDKIFIDPNWSMQAIGIIESCFKEKFAIPRQPGLTPSATATVCLHEPFSAAETVRGLEQFTHIWVIFAFHATAEAGWRPTVRPPKLGGNIRKGVFATRTTHRPNPIGMSVVKLSGIDTKNGVRLMIEGGDFLDGTPVLDIKPYLPYADAIVDAGDGYADTGEQLMNVTFSQQANESINILQSSHPRLRALITEVLAQDPRPGYAEDTDRIYGMSLYGLNIRWRGEANTAHVLSVDPA